MTLAIQPLITNNINQYTYSAKLSSQSNKKISGISFTGMEDGKTSIWAKIKQHKTKITELLCYGLGIFYLGLGGAVAFGGLNHGTFFDTLKGFLGVKPNSVAVVIAADGVCNIGLGVATHYWGEKASTFFSRQFSKVFSGIKKMIFRR